MARYRPAGSKKPTGRPPQARAAIPCLIILIFIAGVVALLFYFTMQSSAP